MKLNRIKLIKTATTEFNFSKKMFSKLLTDIKHRKNIYTSSLTDKTVKNINIVEKKKIFKILTRKLKKSKYTKVEFSFSLFCVRIGIFNNFLKFLTPKIQSDKLSEHHYIFISSYEWEYFSCIKSSLTSLQKGFKSISVCKNIHKEYFRLLIYYFKKKNIVTEYKHPKNWPNKILLPVVCSFYSWNLNKFILEIFIQMSTREIWYLSNLKFVYKYFERIVKLKPCDNIYLFENLHYLLIPESSTAELLIIKCLTENCLFSRCINKKNFNMMYNSFEDLLPEKKKKELCIYSNVVKKNLLEFVRVKLFFLR